MMKILKGIKLYRDVRIGQTRFRGSRDSSGGDVDYLFDLFPAGYFQGKRILDLGSAGGAMCFEAVERGCAMATGVEIAENRIKGAWAIQRQARVANVRFLKQDMFHYLKNTNERYDAVFALNILHHIRNPFSFLRTICLVSREFICIEAPEDLTGVDFGEYGQGLSSDEAGMPVERARAYLDYLKLMDFYVERQVGSDSERAFYMSGRTRRSAFLLRYHQMPKDRETRRQEMQLFKPLRDNMDAQIRAKERLVEWADGADLIAQLHRVMPQAWRDRPKNFLLIGPCASGKSTIYETLPKAHQPPYSPKVFKFPNYLGQRGLKQHLHPTWTRHGHFAHVMLSTPDDKSANATLEEFVRAVKGKDVVCILCYCDFETHVDMLCKRADESLPFDLALQFDYLKWIQQLTAHNIPYVVVTPWRRS